MTMLMKRKGLVALLAVSLSGAACSMHAADTAAAAPTAVTIANFTFAPATVEVARGTTVEWINADDVPHVVTGTSADSPLRSPALDTDDRYRVTFDRPGRYPYFCSLHPKMVGTIVVK
jgi:plastocyanin